MHKFALAVAATLALLVALTVASSAEEPVPDAHTVTLQPGDNYVGWVGDAISVEDIFAAIPEAALIYTWDADSRFWRYAIRGVGGPLETLEPGMAAMVRVVGDEPVEWTRPLTPAKGSVALNTGVNWVTWLGREGWPLDQLVRGIGKSLVSIQLGDAIYAVPIDAPDTELPAVRRGDALKVTVSRDLRWLQPTGIMPRIVWVGEYPQSLQSELTAEIREIVDYFAETHGVETDFSDTTILLWHTIEDVVAYQDSSPQYPFHLGGEALRLSLTDGPGGGTAWGAFLTSDWWQLNPSRSRFKTLLTHEWFHYLQIQYTDFWATAGKPPEWILEGTAVWSGDEGIRIADDLETFEETRREHLDSAKVTSATLRSAEERNTPWQYVLGLLAVDLLVERNGADSMVEYFRQQHPQAVGADRRWQSRPELAEAFLAAFGLEPDAFYTEFEEWREALPGRRIRDSGEPKLRGRLLNASGESAAGFWINAAPYEGEHKAGRIRRSEVMEDGSFVVDLKPNTTQRIWITRDGCELWVTDEGLTTQRPEPGQYRDLDTDRLPTLELELPEDACRWQLRMRVLGLRGDTRPIDVVVQGESSYDWAKRHWDGGFVWFAPAAGEYQVGIKVDGCELWYRSGRLFPAKDDAAWLQLAGDPVELEVRVPHDLCVRTLTGRLIDEEGSPLGDVWISAEGQGTASLSYTDSNGQFTITVPESGDYGLYFWQDDCFVAYRQPEATGDWARAERIDVSGEDVTGIEFRVPNRLFESCR